MILQSLRIRLTSNPAARCGTEASFVMCMRPPHRMDHGKPPLVRPVSMTPPNENSSKNPGLISLHLIHPVLSYCLLSPYSRSACCFRARSDWPFDVRMYPSGFLLKQRSLQSPCPYDLLFKFQVFFQYFRLEWTTYLTCQLTAVSSIKLAFQ